MSTKLVIMSCIATLLGAGMAAAQVNIDAGLVTYFKLDEGMGDTLARDASGNGNDGTLIGDNLQWVTGYDGVALEYTPPLDVDAPDRLEYPTTGMSATAGTVAVWAYLADPQPGTSGRYIYGHTTQPQFNNRIQIYMQDGTNVSRLLDIGLGGAHTLKTDIMELPMNEWLHVALTWNNGAYVVYVDAEQVDSGTYSDMTALHPVANFGNDGSNAPYEAFCGMLDEARVYNRAITAAEVKAICDLPATPAMPRIKAWAPQPADGARDVTMPLFKWKSADTIRMHNVYVGTDPNLTEANLVGSRVPVNLYYHAPGIQPGTTYYWRVDGIDPDLVTIYTGDVWSFLAQPPTAYDPVPADGANTAPLSQELTWLAGIAALKHHVYFGDSLDAVTEGTADVDQGIFDDPNFKPGELLPATIYYWRIDEIGPADVLQTGSVWSFATMVPIDDFESYTDDEGSRIYETWLDGFADGSSGSMVGYAEAPFAEQTIVHGGAQSMPLDYNNVDSPFFSEAERTFATAQDWTADGVDTLVLYVRGQPGNAEEPLYVALKDTSNRTGTVVYADTAVMKATKWVEWKIPLSAFADAGVNLTRVKTLYLGVGDKANPVQGGAGLLYIDDIGLAVPVPME